MSVSRATVVLKPPLAGVDLRRGRAWRRPPPWANRCAREAIEAGKLGDWASPQTVRQHTHPAARP